MADYKIQWNGLVDDSDPDSLASADNNEVPSSVDLWTWGAGWWSGGGYVPDHTCPQKQNHATEPQCYWEDYDINEDGIINILDAQIWQNPDNDPYNNPYLNCALNSFWHNHDCNSLLPAITGINEGWSYLYKVILGGGVYVTNPPKASETKFIDQSSIFASWIGFRPDKVYTWGDVSFIIEIADGIGTGSRRSREARLQQLDKDKKKRLIHLICRVKGEKVYDEKKLVGDVQIKLDDVDLVIERILGKMRVENTNVL